MDETAEPDLIRTPEELAPPPIRPATGPWPLVAIIVAIVAILAGGYWFLQRPGPPAVVTETPTAPPAAPVTATPPLGSNPFPADVPPLDASDAFVRTWVPRLSAHPRVAAWLTTTGLIRNFVTVVSAVAEGRTPAGQLAILKPRGPFQVVERGGAQFVDPRSFLRYDDLVAGFDSLDAAAAAQLYATLKPRIEEAHAELGGRGSFDATLERAIVQLLQTPVSDRAWQVEPWGIGYRSTDDRLDGLSGAQKHLLRLGPEQARRVQAHLRDLALALGIPASHLPAVR